MDTALQRIERFLFTAAALCLVYVAVTMYEAAYYRGAARALAVATQPAAPTGAAAADEGMAATTTSSNSSIRPAAASPLAGRALSGSTGKVRAVTGDRVGRSAAGLIGELAIPHLGISTAILEGDNWQALRRGAGHMPGTALPGQHGNVVLAGHRDTVFRRLAEIHRGDRLRVTTTEGTYDYRVSRTLKVAPRDVWVLDADAAALTLITCYPFTWVGSAPERWIVQAEREQPGISN